jgi:hypothetical protein
MSWTKGVPLTRRKLLGNRNIWVQDIVGFIAASVSDFFVNIGFLFIRRLDFQQLIEYLDQRAAIKRKSVVMECSRQASAHKNSMSTWLIG